jgi:hypothetical protein
MKTKNTMIWAGMVCLVFILTAFSGFGTGTGNQNIEVEFTAHTIINAGRMNFDIAQGLLEIPDEYYIETYPENSNGLYFVQFAQNTETWMLDELGSLGMNYYQFNNRNTYVIEIPASMEQTVRGLPFVQWVGIYQPYYKLSEEVAGINGAATIDIELTGTGEVNHIIQLAKSLGGTLENVVDDLVKIVRINIHSSQFPALAAERSVYWMSLYHSPQTLMNFIRDTAYTGANTPYSNGYTGSRILGQVKDNGCDLGHGDLTNVIYTQGGPVTDSHGTCTTGIVFGTGAGSFDARGMLPAGIGCFADWGVGRTTGLMNLWNGFSSGKNGVFESNSWFTGSCDGTYTTYPSQDDAAMYDYPKVLMLWAAGNCNGGEGWGLITQDSSNKNGLCIGAVWHEDTATMADDDWRYDPTWACGSRGFAADTRLKPDLCGPYDYIYCTDVRGAGGYRPTNYVTKESYDMYFGGTSGATPVVAGQVGIAYDMYMGNHFGNNPGGFIPYSSTIKAIMIADAYQYPDFVNQADRHEQGWGSADIENVYNLGASGHYIQDGVNTCSDGQTYWYNVTPIGGGTPLKISLVWTDPEAPSSTGSNPALINNLDLKVTAPGGGTVYYGNNGLDDARWSDSGTGSNYWAGGETPVYFDNRNNVENVFIETPVAGSWQIEVSARSGEVPQGPQRFSLVASGAHETLPNTPPTVWLSAPNGGESWEANTNHAITWTMSDTEDPATSLLVTLDYSTNGGSTFPYNIITDQTGFGASGTYSWLLPNAPGANVRVRVTVRDSSGGTANDASNASFTIIINAPTVQVTSPNGGEYLMGGGSWDVTWNAIQGSYPLTASPITIYYSTTGSGGPWTLLASSQANDGIYTWSGIPVINNSNCFVRITAIDSQGLTGQDLSDSSSTIDSAWPLPATNPRAELTGINDVTVYWTASASADVAYYNVYYISNGWDPAATGYSLVGNTTGTSYTHAGQGNFSGNDVCYQVRTFDKAGHETRTIIQAAKFTKIISASATVAWGGWVMLGSSLVQSSYAVSHKLQGQGFGMNGFYNWSAVELYNAWDNANHWKFNLRNGTASLNEITTINNTQGFWLCAYNSARFSSAGYVSNLSVPLKAGWNLVPYPLAARSWSTLQVRDHLIANCPSFGGTYNNDMEIFSRSNPYRLITPTGSEALTHQDALWVRVTADTTWNVINY